ncbi:MAG: hypothetical protein ABWY94_07765 [Pseudoxanthomonas sp.]
MFMIRCAKSLLVVLMSGLSFVAGAEAPGASTPLQFRINEGRTLNAFYQQGPAAAHLLLNSGTQPRVLAAFPAGNSGTGIWFEPAKAPVQWKLDDMHAFEQADPKGRPLHGIVATASVDTTLVVRDAVLGSVRVLRDYQIEGRYPAETKATPTRSGNTLTWSRTRLDGAPGYLISVAVETGDLVGGGDAPWTFTAPASGEPMRLRITALTGETPLTPLGESRLLNAQAGADVRSGQALAFLSYEEKFLAGSWRFDTYFGRDTLMSLRLLMPALQPLAIEEGLASVLERLDPRGEVAHEEDIGEFAVLRHRKEGRDSAAPIYDYGMIDDDFMLAPVAVSYLLDQPDGRARAAQFLARKLPSGETAGTALARNFAFVVESAKAFAASPEPRNLVSIKPGRKTGQWRDSEDGLADGRYAYDVNAVFVPAALGAIARFKEEGLLAPHATPQQADILAAAAASATVWTQRAPPLFRVRLPAIDAQRQVRAYATSQGIDAASAIATLPPTGLDFAAIALDEHGAPIPVLHSDSGFALLMQDPAAGELERMVEAMLRPFPAGLLTDAGLLVANPAFADADIQRRLGRNAYHGAVVWSWQQALLAAGLERQLRRPDLPASALANLRDAQGKLWAAINNTQGMRTSELWSWTYADGRYQPAPFGQNSGDADESNAAQLWSTVYLALPAPETASAPKERAGK